MFSCVPRAAALRAHHRVIREMNSKPTEPEPPGSFTRQGEVGLYATSFSSLMARIGTIGSAMLSALRSPRLLAVHLNRRNHQRLSAAGLSSARLRLRSGRHRSDSFREGALRAVNLGNDADTTGAIYMCHVHLIVPENWKPNSPTQCQGNAGNCSSFSRSASQRNGQIRSRCYDFIIVCVACAGLQKATKKKLLRLLSIAIWMHEINQMIALGRSALCRAPSSVEKTPARPPVRNFKIAEQTVGNIKATYPADAGSSE